MRLQIVSDLHLEMYNNPNRVLDAFKPDGVDVLILAGDILSLRLYEAIFERFCKMYPNVIYVPGNHDFWHFHDTISGLLKRPKHPNEVLSRLEDFDKATPNFTFLQTGKVVSIQGHRFLGDTMWFPKNKATEDNQYGWPDFIFVKDGKEWMYQRNDLFRKFIKTELKENDIVITHHLPDRASTPERFRKDPTNCYFLSDVSDIILDKKPRLWIHGHTHDCFDYRLGTTRVICNPQDYPNRRALSGVNEKIIEV